MLGNIFKIKCGRSIQTIACVVFLSTFGCSERSQDATLEASIPTLEVAIVTQKDVPLGVEFVGQIKGSIDADVRARVEGVITSINFEEGKEVSEGQLLYTIDSAPYEAKVSQAQGKLAEAKTGLVKAESDLKRVRPLAEMKALSARDLDAAIAQQGVAQGAVDAAIASVDAAKIELGYCKINSPTRGVIGLSKAKIGEFVGRPPNPVVLNTVSNLDPIHVRFTVNEKEFLYFSRLKLKQIESGKEAEKRLLELYLADGSKHAETGEVISVDRQIDSSTGSITVEAAFPNPHKLLRPGQFAKIKTIGETISNALLIPKRGIREIQGQYQIFVVKDDGTLEQRKVVPGSELGSLQIIQGTVSPGEKVVVEGLQRLKSGMKIIPRHVE